MSYVAQDLRGLDFSGGNLCGADFRMADLRGCNFRGADLSGAVFDGAHMHCSCLAECNVEGASFRACKMIGVDVQGTDLDDADTRRSEVLLYEGGTTPRRHARVKSLRRQHYDKHIAGKRKR